MLPWGNENFSLKRKQSKVKSSLASHRKFAYLENIKAGMNRTLVRAIIIFLISCFATVPISSFLGKYLLERYDVQWLGREITADRAYINPFTGYVYLSDVKIFEEKGDSLFISAESANARIFLPKLFFREVEINHLMIDRPRASLVQNKDTLNFDDLIRRFASTGTRSTSPWHVTLLTAKINDGVFHYREKVIPINYFVAGVNIETDGKKQDVDTVAVKFYFREGKSEGDMQGNLVINLKNADYRLDLTSRDFDMEIMRQYIWELINYGMFRARLDAHILATGNFLVQDSIKLRGTMAIRDFHLGRTTEDDYFSFAKIAIAVEALSPIDKLFLVDSLILTDPYLRYERFDSLDNVQAMFGKAGKNITDVTRQPARFNLIIEIARYIKVLTGNFFKSEYKIRKLGVYNGTFTFKDFSLNEEFSATIGPLTVTADSVNSNEKRVELIARSRIQPYGDAEVFLSLNPKDSGDFDIIYSFQQIPASAFNPYLVTYTSFPLDRGTIGMKGTWQVRSGEIQSDNHLVLVDPRVTQRTKNKNTKWLPMPLIMALVREQGNVVDYEIPITGNLKNPNFHLGDVILDLIGNIFVKPPTFPYRKHVKEVESRIENSLSVKWEMSQYILRRDQVVLLKRISKFLKDHPEVFIKVQPFQYTSKEKEHILFFETKKKYYMLIHDMTAADFGRTDSIHVTRMSIKDNDLLRHLSKNLRDTVMFTLQEKCINYVGNEVVNSGFEKLTNAREMSFRSIFLNDGTGSQVNMHTGRSGIPYAGFSQFILSYPGTIPATLVEAYEEMNDLDDEGSRKKYRKQRQKTAKAALSKGML
jgi:hypothetical protein